MGRLELTESALAAAAGTRSFGHGESLVRAVRGLRTTEGRATGSVQGRSVYAVELTWDQGSLRGSCTCPHAARGNFCKHMVALGLAALDGEMRVPSSPAQSAVDSYLATLDEAQLRALVQEMAGFSDAATRALEVRAAGAGGDTSAVSDELVAAVRDALAVRGFIDYRRSFEVARDAQHLLDELETHLDGGGADTVRPALLRALTRLRSITQHADDSSGSIGDACQRAANLYARSCREGKPEPVKLAKWLVKFRDESPGWPNVTLADFADAFDDKALKTYRAAVAALDVRDAGKDHFKRFELDLMLLELADHDGDVDRAVQLLSSGDHPRFAAIAQRLLRVGRHEEALAWVDRGVAAGRVSSRMQSGDFWMAGEWVARLYLDEGRPEDALAALRDQFAREPSVSTYVQLTQFADELGRGRAEREAAWETAEHQARRFSHGALLIELALHEGDLDRAWSVADRYRPGHGLDKLAAASAEIYPERTLDLYASQLPELLTHSDPRSYKKVADLLLTMRRVAEPAGLVEVVDRQVRAIRAEYVRRPSMMAALDRAGLPR